MTDIRWNKIMLREFESLACLTDDEKEVLQDWAHGKSVVSSAMRLHRRAKCFISIHAPGWR